MTSSTRCGCETTWIHKGAVATRSDHGARVTAPKHSGVQSLVCHSTCCKRNPRDLVDDKEGERVEPGKKNALEADLDNAAIKAPLGVVCRHGAKLLIVRVLSSADSTLWKLMCRTENR